jgi:large subunit ribosomal protein L18
MSMLGRLKLRSQRRKFRVRNHLLGDRLRVSVFRSNKHIFAQIIDDKAHKTLASCSSLDITTTSKDNKTAIAHKVGLELAQKAVQEAISKDVKFDRGAFLYHGRVKALADGLREGGLNF